eukprot:3887813-Amphidinium_carterae.2
MLSQHLLGARNTKSTAMSTSRVKFNCVSKGPHASKNSFRQAVATISKVHTLRGQPHQINTRQGGPWRSLLCYH